MTYSDPGIKQIKYGDELQPDEVDALLRYTKEKIETVLKLYAVLVSKAKGVTGRTILDSEHSWRYLRPLVIVTLIFVVLAAIRKD